MHLTHHIVFKSLFKAFTLPSPKIKFKKMPVAKLERAVVLELKSGTKAHGLSLNELLQVIKDEAS